jgi:hypothetical protein
MRTRSSSRQIWRSIGEIGSAELVCGLGGAHFSSRSSATVPPTHCMRSNPSDRRLSTIWTGNVSRKPDPHSSVWKRRYWRAEPSSVTRLPVLRIWRSSVSTYARRTFLALAAGCRVRRARQDTTPPITNATRRTAASLRAHRRASRPASSSLGTTTRHAPIASRGFFTAATTSVPPSDFTGWDLRPPVVPPDLPVTCALR